MTSIHLGYEVGAGEAVEIPLRHMVVTGQTQEAGKTTTLEALIARANLPAVAFVTKRGERSFGDARRIQPYFRERADWQFVASVIEATMRERMKYERAWIVRASKGAKTLADVQRNVQRLMEKHKSGKSADMYMMLNEYLGIVVPRVASIRWAQSLELEPGINVLDVSHRDKFPPELQSLVMRSALEWVYENCDGTITIIPEAWEFCPQGRGSPAKLAAIELIRKGAGLHNFVWLDSQDIGGVDKELLRSCPVWLLGVQREANEIKRVLDNIPAGIAKPKPADVALLEKGQFYACFGRHTVKTYVQPAWMTNEQARLVATGEMRHDYVRPPIPATIEPPPEEEDVMSKAAEEKLDTLIDLMRESLSRESSPTPAYASAPPANGAATAVLDEEALYQRFKARLAKEAPAILKVLGAKPEIRIEDRIEVIEMDGKTAEGRVARLVHDGFFDAKRKAGEAEAEINKRGGNLEGITVYKAIETLVEKGFLWREKLSNRAVVYSAVDGMKQNIARTQ